MAGDGEQPGLGETRAGAGGRVDETRVSGEGKFAAVRSSAPGVDETHVRSSAQFADESQVRGSSRLVDETRVRGSARFLDDSGLDDSAVVERVVASGRIGRFMVLRELGRGAMGVVFAAYDEELDRKVAIKLLHADRGKHASLGRAMLLREAQALARLAHPNVVAVHEVGVIEGAVFVAMEYVAGVDVQRWLTDVQRPWREVVAVLRQAGEGLVAAHREGLVHRDFKPSNALVGDDGRVRVVDFGLAARRGAAEGGRTMPAGASTSETLTGSGALVGTPLYMAPELLRGESATASSDQYAYCVTLYEGLYGVRPFVGETLAELVAAVERRQLPATPPRAGVPLWLHAAVCRGLARAPGERHAELADLVGLLARDPEAERQQRRRRMLQIAGAIAATAVVVAAIVFGYQAIRRYAAERQAEVRLAALRGQIEALQGRGEADEAARLLHTFVTLPDNRGSAVIARAYLEWAAGQTDAAAAIDAYASAYITARTPEHGRTALRGLIARLSAHGQIGEAAAALAVLAREAPDEAAAPELQGVRLAAALARRDLPRARAALVAEDLDGWSAVLEELSHATVYPPGKLARTDPYEYWMRVLDHDGDGTPEVMGWTYGARADVDVFRLEPGLTPLRRFAVEGASKFSPVSPVTAGERLLLASRGTRDPQRSELRLLRLEPDDTTTTLDAWTDSSVFADVTVDLDGDGARELYIGTQAYMRRLWRMDRAADGTWTRRSAHPPTDAAASDVLGVVAADLEGDGRPELVAGVGPWKAYDLRVFKPVAGGGLDLVARRSFGPVEHLLRLRGVGEDIVAFVKTDGQIAPDRFPPDRPLGEPAGLYLAGLRGGEVAVLGHVPTQLDGGAARPMGRVFAGDLDGDGQDEVVVDARTAGMMLVRWREGAPLRPLVLAGLLPLLVHDLDGDGDAEIVAGLLDQPGQAVLLGAGDDTLAPLAGVDLEPRAVPVGIEDPAIAEAWTRGEQLVAIGLPRRTAEELSAIAGLSGHVAPDMLLRTAELYAAVGDDEAAAEHYVAAAGRPALASQALAGAAQARRRRGEFVEAEALTRRRLAVVDERGRAAVEAELAALTEATAARPELAWTFDRPLARGWDIHDPVAVRRSLARGELSVWTSPTSVLAELPLVWDGGPAELEVEFQVDRLEWGNEVAIEIAGPDGRGWLTVTAGGFGLSEAPTTSVNASDGGYGAERQKSATDVVRGRIAVFPGFTTAIREIHQGTATTRTVRAMYEGMPPPGPVHLRVVSRQMTTVYVGHVWIRSIRVRGFTAGVADGVDDEAARLLVEGQFAAAAAALQSAEVGSERQVWRIDALLGRGQVDEAATEIAAMLAAAPEDGPAFAALFKRMRRGDDVTWMAARAGFGPRLIELWLSNGMISVRPVDVEAVLIGLPAPATDDQPSDEQAALVLAWTDYARGSAHLRAGQLAAAREAYTAAFTRTLAMDGASQLVAIVQSRTLRDLLKVAVAAGDRDEAVKWVRKLMATSVTPYLTLERMQAEEALGELVGPALWTSLAAELRAERP